MQYTQSLTKNYEFKRVYNKGKSAVSKFVAVYCLKNRRTINRLGITVSTKLGESVKRNRIRRRLKEIYRLNEQVLCTGYDIVIVARQRSRHAGWSELQASVLHLFNSLFLTTESD